MRTTLTLEDDVVTLIKKAQESSGKTFKEVVNDAIRHGLSGAEEKDRRRRPFRTRGRDLGRSRLPSLDNVAEALALGEGEGFR